MRVAVVGAGVAGLTCARDLAEAGSDVIVFERGREVGGRAGQCVPHPNGQVVDHGAPYFTVRRADFGDVVAQLAARGAARVWCDRFDTWDGAPGPGPASAAGYARWCLPDGMGGLAAHLGRDVPVRFGQRVQSLRAAGGVRLVMRAGAQAGPFDAVVLAVPAPVGAAVARTFLPGDDQLLGVLENVALHPVLVVAAGYPPTLSPPWRAYVVTGGAELTWLAHDSSKRREPQQCVLVGHASPGWSAAHYEDPPEAITRSMVRSLARVAGAWAARPEWVGVHLWRYAIPPAPLGVGAVASTVAPIVACGEWSAAARVEGAYVAGRAAARLVLGAAS